MSKGFKEYVDLTPDERAALRKLSSSPDFANLKIIMEKLLQSLAYNAMIDSGDEEYVKHEIDMVRGGYNYYKTLFALIDRANGKITQDSGGVGGTY